MLFPTSTELETRLAGSVARFALGSFLIYAVKSRRKRPTTAELLELPCSRVWLEGTFVSGVTLQAGRASPTLRQPHVHAPLLRPN